MAFVRAARLILKLGRMKMTVFSAVTYAAAASLAYHDEFDAGLFLAGWAFVFFTQLVAHFLGEYYDLASDKLNSHAGPLTGGSRVLVSGDITPTQCFALGYASLATTVSILTCILPRRCWPVGSALIFIAHQYSAPPFKLNHVGLGELAASLATNALLPQFAALVQSASFEEGVPLMFHRSLAVLVLPAFFLKVGLFVALNMEDRRPDWLGGKYTLPVLLGEEACSRLFAACSVLAYVSAVCVFFAGLCPATTLAAILLSAPEALSIARAFNPSLTLPRQMPNIKAGGKAPHRPHHLTGLVVRVLKHAPLVVLAVFADTLIREAVAAGAASAAGDGDDGAVKWYRWLVGVGTLLFSTSTWVRCLPLVPFVYLFFVKKPPSPPPPRSAAVDSAANPPEQHPRIVVAGGGVGGLVLGACLQQLGLPFEILEKKRDSNDDGGADLALWPAAAKILKELGVGSQEPGERGSADKPDFWEQKTYPVGPVRICKVDQQAQDASQASTPTSGPCDKNGRVQGFVPAPDVVLTTVDMDAVVGGTEEPFRLVGRQALMSVLLPLVDERRIRRGARVVRAEQSFPPQDSTARAYITTAAESIVDDGADSSPSDKPTKTQPSFTTCRVLVGADGIHSMCRLEVSAAAAALATLGRENSAGHSSPSDLATATAKHPSVRAVGPRDGGEVCYRGVLDLKEGSEAATAGLRTLFEKDEETRPRSMSVVYGDRIRFSWGFIDGTRETGYWFVKQLTEKKCDTIDASKEDVVRNTPRVGEAWPEPLRTFARITPAECSYVHRIQDRPPLARWSCNNITLLGDACHPATPNNGQGACMAIEDALVLATLLAEHWEERDGQVEAFYLYEKARLAHTRRVQQESSKQMKLGQLTSRVGIWVREFAIGLIPPRVLQKKLRAANVFEIDPWLTKFRMLKAKRAGSAVETHSWT